MWVCVVTGCNKVPVEIHEVVEKEDDICKVVNELGGDPTEDLVEKYENPECEEELPEYMPLDNGDIEYKVFKIESDPKHKCLFEKDGRRLYCVKKNSLSTKEIVGLVEATVI